MTIFKTACFDCKLNSNTHSLFGDEDAYEEIVPTKFKLVIIKNQIVT